MTVEQAPPPPGLVYILGWWREVSTAPLMSAVVLTARPRVQTGVAYIADDAGNVMYGAGVRAATDAEGRALLTLVWVEGAVYDVEFGGVKGTLRCDDWAEGSTVPFTGIRGIPGGDPLPPTGAAGGGLTGTYPNPTVRAVRGVTVSATAPTAGQVLTASSGTAAVWTTPMGSQAVRDLVAGIVATDPSVVDAAVLAASNTANLVRLTPSKNLLDVSKVHTVDALWSTSVAAPASGLPSYTGWVAGLPFAVGAGVTLTGIRIGTVQFRDAAGAYLGWISNSNTPNTPLTFTTPANTAQVAISWKGADAATAQVEVGPSATSYAPFGGTVTGYKGSDRTPLLTQGELDAQLPAKVAALTPPVTFPRNAFKMLRATLELPATKRRVAVISDSTANDIDDWVRVWSLLIGPMALPAVRRAYHSWDATASAWRAEVVDAPGVGTPPLSGLNFADDFNRTAAELVGSTTSSGHTWAGTAGTWSADGAVARAGSGQKYLSYNVGTRDVTASWKVNLVTTATGATQTYRFMLGHSGASNNADSVWGFVSITSTGDTSIGLWKTVGGTSSAITTLSGHGLVTNSATTQVLDVTVKLEIQSVTLTVSRDGGAPITVTGSISESEYAALGTYVTTFASASSPGMSIDSVLFNRPAVPATFPAALDVWNGAIAGTRPSYYSAAKCAEMFPVGTVGNIDVLVIAGGHNNGVQTPVDFITEMDAAIVAFRSVHPNAAIIVSSQNPQIGTVGANAHLLRQGEVRDWAERKGYSYIPAMEAFAAKPDGGQSLIKPDGVHPTTSGLPNVTTGDYGAVLWAQVARDALGSA